MAGTLTAPGYLRVHSAGATDIGRGRTHNADAVLLRPDLNLFAIADGTGGSGGNVASALATTSIATSFGSTDLAFRSHPDVDELGLYTGARRLAGAVQKANLDIVEIAKTSNKHKGMGSTIVAVAISPEAGLLHVAHVGDSRCYRLRAGMLELLTDDHTLMHDVLELRPDIDDDSLAQLPENVVTRALGMKEGLRVSSKTHQICPGDRYLLCSDGLSDALSEEAIRETLALTKTPEDLVRMMIRMVNETGGHDNIAAIVLECEMPAGMKFRPKRVAPRARRTSRSDRPPTDLNLAAQRDLALEELSSDHLDDDPTKQNKRPPPPARVPSAAKMRTPRPAGTMRMVRCPKCNRALEAGQLCPTCGVPKARR
jgi:PPM family protein phosphatase